LEETERGDLKPLIEVLAMSASAAPFGLRPDYHGSGGTIRPTSYTITSGYGTNILNNAPVKIVPSSTGEGTIALGAPGDRIIGAFAGCRYTDGNGQTLFSNKWISGTTGTDIECWVTEDPNIFYEIQANATMTVADIGKQYDWTAESGNVTVGNSAIALNVASTDTNAGLQVVGLRVGPDNNFGDAFPIVTVRISEHQFVADVAAF
jgi:hypothetical protein